MLMYPKSRKEIENMWVNLTKKELINCNGGGLPSPITISQWIADLFKKFK